MPSCGCYRVLETQLSFQPPDAYTIPYGALAECHNKEKDGCKDSVITKEKERAREKFQVTFPAKEKSFRSFRLVNRQGKEKSFRSFRLVNHQGKEKKSFLLVLLYLLVIL
jgi:hypothetical protein